VAEAPVKEQLQKHVDDAVEKLKREGLTSPQRRAIVDHPNLEPAFQGERIHTFMFESVADDPALAHLLPTRRGKFGPDFVEPGTGFWYDATTFEQWQAHVRKYGPDGIPLFYRLPR
jgi:hypothetical protein